MARNTNHIADQNDAFRRAEPNVPGQTVLTIGILALLRKVGATLGELAQTVAGFDAFTEDNNPHGERDFGAFVFHGHKVFWKIDYHDPLFERHSDDPADLTLTYRVLTIMLDSEW
jgi:hypothetical protein